MISSILNVLLKYDTNRAIKIEYVHAALEHIICNYSNSIEKTKWAIKRHNDSPDYVFELSIKLSYLYKEREECKDLYDRIGKLLNISSNITNKTEYKDEETLDAMIVEADDLSKDSAIVKYAKQGVD